MKLFIAYALGLTYTGTATVAIGVVYGWAALLLSIPVGAIVILSLVENSRRTLYL